MTEKILNHEEAADFLRVSPRTLNDLQKTPTPPPMTWVGGQRRYLQSQLIEWLKAKSS